MITIKITNALEVVERERNWFVAKLAFHFFDVQNRVEQKIAEEIKKSLLEKNIQTVVSVIKDE